MLNPNSQPPIFMRKRFLMPIAAVVLIILAVYLVMLTRNAWKEYNYIGQSPEFEDRITVEGEAKVTAIPDVASLSIGLTTEKNSVEQAQVENTQKMNQIVSLLKNDFKIADQDIETSQYSIRPKYSWANDRQEIIGYEVNQSVSVKVRDFANIGEIIARAGQNGSNQVSGPNFTIDDDETYKEQARQQAIDNAQAKAKVLANQLGIKLGPVVNFSESSDQPIYYDNYAKSAVMGFGGAEDTLAPQIEAGSDEVMVRVYISYEIW